MEDIDFENLISLQLLDTGTAEILGQYYIKGKYVDNYFGVFGAVGFILLILLFLFIFRDS